MCYSIKVVRTNETLKIPYEATLILKLELGWSSIEKTARQSWRKPSKFFLTDSPKNWIFQNRKENRLYFFIFINSKLDMK